MQRINLLYIITKLELGGAQKQLLSLVSHLDKDKFNIFLFTAKDGLLVSQAASIKGLALKKSRWLERPISPAKDIFALIQIYGFIKKNKIEIVHTHSSKAGILGRWAARLAGIKVIIHTVHGWSFNDYQPALKRMFFIWIEKISAKFSHKLIVVSHYDKQKGLDNYIGCESQYQLIRYGIDYSDFSGNNQGIRDELGIKSHDSVVGMISCFKPQKSPEDFVKLAALLIKDFSDLKFLLVGDGILRKDIEQLIYKFNLQGKVILTGWRRDIPAILSTLDVFVLTSLWEGLPITVLEAMASGKPVVVTHTGGVKEVISEGKTGFLVAQRDINKMREKIIILLKDKKLRKEIGDNAKASLGVNFSYQNKIDETQGLYNNLIKMKMN